jgi:DNA-binding transcriptional LysR family regulator
MDDLEVRELRAYAAVAEELHFGRAAERLNVAQPALSRTIAKLEARLGTTLIERTTRSATLTAAGEVLLTEAHAVLDAVSAAAARTRRAADPSRPIVVALKADGDGRLLADVLSAYAEETRRLRAGATPDAAAAIATPELLFTTSPDIAPTLRDGRADVALLSAPFAAHGLDTELLLRQARVLALPADHPLAARPQLRMADLAGETFPRWTNLQEPLTSHWTAPGAVEGPPAAHLGQALLLVEVGRAMTFVPGTAGDDPRRGIAYRSVEGLLPTELHVAWPTSSRSPLVAAFVRAAMEVAARREAVPPLALAPAPALRIA